VVAKLANLRRSSRLSPAAVIALAFVGAPSLAGAVPAVVQNPNVEPQPAPVVIDFSPDAPAHLRPRVERDPAPAVRFEDLDLYRNPAVDDAWQDEVGVPALPDGMRQVGGMVMPDEVAEGAAMVGDALTPYLSAGIPGTGALVDEVCDFPDETPPGIYDYDYRPGMELPRFHTVYLNFVGATLATGAENAAENLSGIALSGHPFPPYAGGEQNAIAVAQAIQQDLADWAIRVVYLERPPKVLPYSMVMIGGHWSDTTAGPSGGVAPLDCEDFGQRNVCYAFQNTGPTTSQANVASQEIGHTMGLHHTSASDSVMAAGYASTQGGDLGFNDSCAPTIAVAGQGAGCAGVNKCHCGDGELQHDKKTLSVIFAPAGVDTTEPTIELTSPADGQHFLPGEDIVVGFDPWDDVGGYGWKMIVENEAGEVLVDQVDYDRALEFVLTQLPEGEYTITGLIMDHADHVVTDSVTITVEAAAGEDGGTGDGTGDGGTASGDDSNVVDDSGGGDVDPATDDGSGEGDGTGDTDPGLDLDEGGCGCTTAPRSAPWALALFGLVALRRRRA
jgi:MYXO-CTERM domain-containing protein